MSGRENVVKIDRAVAKKETHKMAKCSLSFCSQGLTAAGTNYRPPTSPLPVPPPATTLP
jgi:hypothetical protein